MKYEIVMTSACTRYRVDSQGITWEKLCNGRWVLDTI